MSEHDELDLSNQDTWRRAAVGWERHQAELRESTRAVSEWLIAAVDPQPGQTVLELAAGPGETGFLAAPLLGEAGTLITSDQSPEMVEVARRRAAELGLTNVRFEVLDAQRLGGQPGGVDAVLCRWGVMLMADQQAALRGIRAALRPGGVVALATWDTPQRNLWMAIPGMQLVARGLLERPDPSAPGPFALADPEQVATLLAGAGFGQIESGRVEFVQRYPSFDRYWETIVDMSAPIAALLASLDQPVIAELREAVRRAIGQFGIADGSLEVPASAIVASARA